MVSTAHTPPNLDALPSDQRRRGIRIPGPFPGRRFGALAVPLKVHDISVGGCLIESFYEVARGRRITIEVELPAAGWVRLKAEVLYQRPHFGFAVRWVGMSEETRARLAHAIDHLGEAPVEAPARRS